MAFFLICFIFKLLLANNENNSEFRYYFIVSLRYISFLLVEFNCNKIRFWNYIEKIIFLNSAFLDLYLIWRRQTSLLYLLFGILSNTVYIHSLQPLENWILYHAKNSTTQNFRNSRHLVRNNWGKFSLSSEICIKEWVKWLYIIYVPSKGSYMITCPVQC